MVYYRRETKVRWPALKDVEVATVNTDAPVLPGIFSESGSVQRLCTRQLGLCTDSNFPQNPEMQWRLAALGRALTFDLPRPFRFPYMPGFTVMIPHYGESIYMPWEGDGGLCSKSACPFGFLLQCASSACASAVLLSSKLYRCADDESVCRKVV